MRIIYRGYEIVGNEKQGYGIYLGGHRVCSASTEQLAYEWVDGEKKKG